MENTKRLRTARTNNVAFSELYKKKNESPGHPSSCKSGVPASSIVSFLLYNARTGIPPPGFHPV